MNVTATKNKERTRKIVYVARTADDFERDEKGTISIRLQPEKKYDTLLI